MAAPNDPLLLRSTRVLVHGVTGSGKTWLAERIGRATGLPWHATDELAWRPGWTAVPADELRESVTGILTSNAWVLDAAYSAFADLVVERVQLVVALDYPRWVSSVRLVRRTVQRMVNRTPVCNGNVETFRNVFLDRESILLWHGRSFARKRARGRAWEADPFGPPVLRLTSPAQTRRWLAALGDAHRPEAGHGTRDGR